MIHLILVKNEDELSTEYVKLNFLKTTVVSPVISVETEDAEATITSLVKNMVEAEEKRLFVEKI